jgi:hypothetical protein
MSCRRTAALRLKRGHLWVVCCLIAAGTAIAIGAEPQQRGADRPRKPRRPLPAEVNADVQKTPTRQLPAIQASTAAPARTEQAVREALQATVDLHFSKTPLSDLLEAIQDFSHVQIKVDKRALSEVGITSDTPVTFSAHGISLQSALDLILRNLDLAWLVHDEVLLVTTTERADSMLETRVYEVRDLVVAKISYPFEGMYVPGARGGGVGGADGVGGGAAFSGAMGMGGMGAMAGGNAPSDSTGGTAGGGMFSVSDPFDGSGDSQQGNGSSGSEVGSPSAPARKPTGAAGGMMGGGVPSSPQPPSKPTPPGGAGGGMGGGGMGGMGGRGGSARGHFTPAPPPVGTAFDFDSLIDLITSTVNPTNWDSVGGPGSIAPFESGAAPLLILSQTQDTHQKVEKLLGDIRATRLRLPMVTIRATWLALDLNQLDELLASTSGKDGGIDRKVLREMATKVKGCVGTITCFSGQTVHIASGRSRSAIIGAIPVVGSGIGYQPVVTNPQSGAVLQVTPQVLPGMQAAVVDLWSSVVRGDKPAEQVCFLSGEPSSDKADKKGGDGHPTVTLDRVNAAVEQLGTTLKVALGEPTLVGGLTREAPTEQESAAGAPQLYLFIEATAK